MLTESNKILPAGPTARLFRVKVGWLKQEAEAGRIPSLKAGDQYLFDPDAVEQVLLERARQCTATAGGAK